MTHPTLCVLWTHDVQEVITGYRYFLRILLVENLISLFFKNNTFLRRTQQTNTCSKSTKDILEQDVNYF